MSDEGKTVSPTDAVLEAEYLALLAQGQTEQTVSDPTTAISDPAPEVQPDLETAVMPSDNGLIAASENVPVRQVSVVDAALDDLTNLLAQFGSSITDAGEVAVQDEKDSEPERPDQASWSGLFGVDPDFPSNESDVPPNLEELIQRKIAEALGGQVQTPVQNQIQGPPPQHVTFADILQQVDPRDSEAALAMLDWLLRNQRLNRVGVLDGGQGYLFVYSEPKGATKAGYRPGATQGDRIVDAAVEQQRAHGTKRKTGMCPHCLSAVMQFAGDDKVFLDDDDAATTAGPFRSACENSPTGKHDLA